MVTTVHPSTQAHDSDKRRKHSIERTKVVHLTRQLQLRLQYAKLKVEHGWQRQNLNEVENLYFHHSHNIRGFRSQPTANFPDINIERGVAEAPTISSDIDSSNSSQDLKHEAAETHRSLGLPARSEGNDANPLLSSPTIRRRDSIMQLDVPSRPSVDGASSTSAIVPLPPQQQNSRPAVSNSNVGPLFTNPGKWNEKGTVHHPSHPTPQVPTSSVNQPASNTSFIVQNRSPSTATSNAPNMALTYDSFWSNHNTTRPFRSSFFNLLSTSDNEANKITAQALLSGLSAKNITSYLSNVGLSSDFIPTTPSPPSDITPTTTPAIRRVMPVRTAVVDGLKDR